MMDKELPENWAITELGLVTTKPQYGWTSKAGPSGKIKYLRTTDLSKGKVNWETVPYCVKEPEDVEKYQLNKNDILISRAGSVGLSFRIENPPKDAVFASYLIRFKPIIVEIKLIEYFLKSPKYWKSISQVSAGIAVQNINATKLGALELPLPPLPEQKRIVAKLDQLFGHLEVLKAKLDRIPDLLADFRQSVLTQAVTGKLTEEWREGKSLNKFQDLLDDGKVPVPERNLLNGWNNVRISQIANSVSGYAFKSKDFADEGIQLIRMGNLYQDKLDLTRKPVFLPFDYDSDIVNKYSISAGDVLLSLTGTKYKRDYGYAIYVPEGLPRLLVNQRILKLSPIISSKYLVFLLRDNLFRDKFFSFETGGVNQGNVGSRAVESIVVPIPSVTEQEEIVRQVESLFSKADVIEKAYRRLKEKIDNLPQAILKKAFAGELVPQLPDDGDASELIEEIKLMREKLKSKKKSKRR